MDSFLIGVFVISLISGSLVNRLKHWVLNNEGHFTTWFLSYMSDSWGSSAFWRQYSTFAYSGLKFSAGLLVVIRLVGIYGSILWYLNDSVGLHAAVIAGFVMLIIRTSDI